MSPSDGKTMSVKDLSRMSSVSLARKFMIMKIFLIPEIDTLTKE